VTRAARWEWAFAVDAVARGDLLLLLDDAPAAAHRVDPGDRLWLLPSWRNELPAAVKRSWWAEVSRANRERPDDGSVPLRCLCEVVSSHALDAATRTRIAPHHPWSREHADAAERALVVRARAHPEPRPVEAQQTDTYDELALEPADDGLLPALTDAGFALQRAVAEDALEGAHAARG
jgi:Domain of unknown function (DUF1802)